MEIEENELSPAFLHARIESLQFLLGLTIATMSEEQRDYIGRRMSEASRLAEEDANRRDTDPARDFAAALYNATEYLEIRVPEEEGIWGDRRELYGIT